MTSRGGFVTVCGTGFCANGARLWVKGATAYGEFGTPANAVAYARAGNLNTLELTEFDSQHRVLADTESAATWRRVDRFVAAAAGAHLHVILNLSEYGQSLQAAGHSMGSSDWQPRWNQYLRFIARRRNAVTGVVYGRDPTIAMVEIWSEIPAPGYADAVGSTQQMQAFFTNTLRAWKRLAPNILISSGGFSHLNNPRSAVPWQPVMSDPNNAACDIEINSYPDRDITTRMVTSFCRSLGKPWFLSAWSSCNKPRQKSSEINNWSNGDATSTDAAMAAHALDMYRIAKGGDPAAYRALGTDFWNLGPQTADTCQLGPQFPQTWHVIQGN
jgi:hypothetical protein